jgi:hypothetical protein
MTPAWKTEERRRLAAQLKRPGFAKNSQERDEVKTLAESDFLGLFAAHGGRIARGGQLFCLFHDDSAPSAEIWKGLFHCWSCDIRLGVFDFVMRARGCDFKTALDYLALRYGITLRHHKVTPAERRLYEKLRADAEQEGRGLVAWRNNMLAVLRRLRDSYFCSYHRALQLILKYSLRHPQAALWGDVLEACESSYLELDRKIDILLRARWADLLPFFRARSDVPNDEQG